MGLSMAAAVRAVSSRSGGNSSSPASKSVWSRSARAAGLQVVLNQADLDRLQSTVLAGLKERMGGGVTFRASDRFDGGFRVGVGDGGVYYDFSAEAVVDMLSAYLDPKVTALLKEAE